MIRRCRAFTLSEILIVVVILGILAAVLIPPFMNAQKALTMPPEVRQQLVKTYGEDVATLNVGDTFTYTTPAMKVIAVYPTGVQVKSDESSATDFYTWEQLRVKNIIVQKAGGKLPAATSSGKEPVIDPYPVPNST